MNPNFSSTDVQADELASNSTISNSNGAQDARFSQPSQSSQPSQPLQSSQSFQFAVATPFASSDRILPEPLMTVAGTKTQHDGMHDGVAPVMDTTQKNLYRVFELGTAGMSSCEIDLLSPVAIPQNKKPLLSLSCFAGDVDR